MPSLARIEATERAQLITVRDYRIALDLPETGPEFLSETVIRFDARTPGASTFLDVKAAAVESAELNGQPLDPASVQQDRLPLTGLAASNELRLRARMRYANDGEGLHRHVDPADGNTYLYAMSFLDSAPRWFACFDQPDLKARYDIEVQCPPAWIVLGNAPAERVGDGHWRLATSQPLSTYFVTLVAGPYASITAEHDGIPLGLHCRASLAAHLHDEAEDLFAITRDSFDAYHRLFGVRYPFGEYHQVFVPDFNAGAMENPGCVTLRDQFVFRSRASTGQRVLRAATVAHEMAHMWFGDLVTMRWWDDLWLNESFAEYLAYRVCADMPGYPGELSWTQFGITRKDWGSIADQSPSTHPVAGNGSATAAAALAEFDGISYAKGASALRQLAAHLGDDIFFAGLREHFARHRFGNASLADLLDAWTSAGASDVPHWAKQWLQTSGLDTITATVDHGRAIIERTAPDTSRRPHALSVAGYDSAGRRTTTVPLQLTDPLATLTVDPTTALVLADSTDSTWARHRFGDWAHAGALLPRLADSAARTVLYNAIRDGVRSAELSAGQALQLLIPALAVEPVELAVAELFQFCVREVVGIYSPAAHRPARRALLAELAQRLLATAAAGSDAQLTAARALISASDDAVLLQRWLAGVEVPAGVEVDRELRWALLHRLAAVGAAGEAEIEAELARDASTAGRLAAAGARAAIPDKAAKDRAWAALTQPGELSAYEQFSIAQAFFDASQSELVAPWLPRFFPDVAATAAFRSGFALELLCDYAYPVTLASTELIQLAERALAGPLPDGVRRPFTDRTDVARRAVRSQQKFES
ncbi:MAG TPA: aminopeptidase N [Jatrophihabitans sp.]|nr:aminopeptidase N [Jatrophihabitans sp.]